MSARIECDCCGKLEYADDRSDKDAIATITTQHRATGYSTMHLCKECYSRMMKEFFKWDIEEDV